MGVDHRPPQGGVDRGACAVGEARSVSKALCLLLGRRYPFGGSARGAGAVHPGHHRRDAEGRKELLVFTDGIRDSSQSWRDLLLDLKGGGLTTALEIAVAKPALAKAGGALGFWKALGEVWPTTREQRCWVHKTANILNKMPKSLHTKAKRSLQEIWMAETKKDAVKALEAFVETYQVKYNRATDCLIKDRDALLAVYDSPAEHWKHLRTTK